MKGSDAITAIKGIGPKTEACFQRLGVKTVEDLLLFYPRGYDVYQKPVPISTLEVNKTQAIVGKILHQNHFRSGGRAKVFGVQVGDSSGQIQVIWFGMPYLRSKLKPGMVLLFRGLVKTNEKFPGRLVMEQPEIFDKKELYDQKISAMQPIYSLTQGLTQKTVQKAVQEALNQIIIDDPFQEVLSQEKFLDRNRAIHEIHFPKDQEMYIKAHNRLVLEEFLTFLLLLKRLKAKKTTSSSELVMKEPFEMNEIIEKLPFSLTSAQKKVYQEMKEDFCHKGQMHRLIQGDVGSGKTILALLALIFVALNGYQGALMAPTEVLAKQHYASAVTLFEKLNLPFKVALLTGSMTAKEKREVYEQIKENKVEVIVGTHALIQEKVKYYNLGLVITDEQHRFGVGQRELLMEKGQCPHVLVMSATPIPRTLGMILYGDMDISVVDEKPANRIPIKNCVVDPSYRDAAYRLMVAEIQKGHQAYIICPMVEESQAMEGENVIAYASDLQEKLGSSIVVAYLHGQMKAEEKQSLMDAFAHNKIHILVSTTVVEVGINVPNATIMMVENAERFGLSQLHQLRGRVGRGKEQSYCIFVQGNKSNATKKRLSILNKSNDGFFIAEEDLKLRGAGDLFGRRQSGEMLFRLGDIYKDQEILYQAASMAEKINQKVQEEKCGKSKLIDYLKELEKGANVVL